MDIKSLVSELEVLNKHYRLGNPLVPDSVYDQKVDLLMSLDPDNDYLNRVGISIPDSDSRKSKLPIEMASMNKCKTLDDLKNWARLKGISLDETMILSAKLDGLSFCVDETNYSSAFSRGDGVYGQYSLDHYKLISNKSTNNLANELGIKTSVYSYGEVIMRRETFTEKYSKDFANARNLVGGQINSKDVTEILKDCNYIRYGLEGYTFTHKSKLFEFLNKNQDQKIPYLLTTINYIIENGGDKYLVDVFKKWNTDYVIDGLIIEVDNQEIAKKLGRETSSKNPGWARAYKGDFEEVKETRVRGIEWNISKQGYMKPIVKLDPINLDGVTVSNVTANNASFVKQLGIGTDSIVKIKRSGMVIPLIVDVVKKTTCELPTNCSSCNHNLVWNESEIELVCLNKNCSGQQIKRIISFFDILDVKNVSEGICIQLYNSGYDTIHKICAMSKDDMLKLDGFAKRKSDIVFDAIHNKLKGVELSKLQHASGLFGMLGSKKLLLLEDLSKLYLITNKLPSTDEIIERDGFSDISANDFISGLTEFKKFINDLPFTLVSKKKVEATSSELSGKVFVFTGVRDKQLEEVIVSKGGKIGSGVSKTTTHLIVKSIGSGSSKEKKAMELGITIKSIDEIKREVE